MAQLGQGNCVGMPPLASIGADGTVPSVEGIIVEGAAAEVDAAETSAVFRWPMLNLPDAAAGEPSCIAVWLRILGGAYESQTERILPVAATEFIHTPVGFAGEYCYRFAVIVGDSRSEFTEACFQLERDQLPPGPDDAFTPLAPTAGQGLSSWSASDQTLLLVAAGLLLLLAIIAPVLLARVRH